MTAPLRAHRTRARRCPEGRKRVRVATIIDVVLAFLPVFYHYDGGDLWRMVGESTPSGRTWRYRFIS